MVARQKRRDAGLWVARGAASAACALALFAPVAARGEGLDQLAADATGSETVELDVEQGEAAAASDNPCGQFEDAATVASEAGESQGEPAQGEPSASPEELTPVEASEGSEAADAGGETDASEAPGAADPDANEAPGTADPDASEAPGTADPDANEPAANPATVQDTTAPASATADATTGDAAAPTPAHASEQTTAGETPVTPDSPAAPAEPPTPAVPAPAVSTTASREISAAAITQSISASADESPWQGGHWVTKGTRRYWYNADGTSYAESTLILPEWGAGYYAYARPNGQVVTRRWSDGTVVYLANGKGRLLSPGWHVTNAYTGTAKQRYYIDPDRHGAVVGYHREQGAVWAHYTLKSGYVLRSGKLRASATATYVANKQGRLMSDGWHVAAAYDPTIQRYYVRDNAAVTGSFSVKGKCYYGIPGKGYVLRGVSKKYLAVASETGVLKHDQWLVTDVFGQGMQRYWLGSDGLAIRDAFTRPKKAGYRAYARPEGYVVRGIYAKGDRVWLADNDGRLMSDGWNVTSAYDLEAGELRRYYIDPKTHSAQVGYSKEGGFAHFGVPGMGYVLEGDACKSGKWVYIATKKGRLPRVKKAGWFVSNAFGRDSELHRYYLEKTPEGVWAARSGISTKGWIHYTHPDTGYVSVNGWVYLKSRGGWCHTSSTGRLGKAQDVRDKLVAGYVGWAVGIANDDSHGYSQKHRWGPEDYDCSSLIIAAIRAAGIHPGRAVYTGNMREELGPRGFQILPFAGASGLRYGDILLNVVTHTEIYIGGGRNVGAHIDENGGIEGRQRGDQTGREICVGGYHNRSNWGYVLRLKG